MKKSDGVAESENRTSQSLRCNKFHSHVGNSFLNSHSCTRWRCSFSQDGRRSDFSENLRVPLFRKKDLSNEPNFRRIHLAGQYLKNIFNYFREYKDRLAASAGEGEEEDEGEDGGQVEADEEDAEGIGFKRKFSFRIFTNSA